MEKQHILIFSHGQTVDQSNKVFSNPNTQMTDLGRQQVMDTIEEVRNSGIKYAKVFCSPLPRAIETAEMINKSLNIPYEVIQELSQQDFGIYTGMKSTPENFAKYLEDLKSENDNCEPLTGVLSNLQIAVSKIAATNQNSIVIAHRFTWLGFELYFNNTPFTPELLSGEEIKTFSREVTDKD